jgi:hypothetical protein
MPITMKYKRIEPVKSWYQVFVGEAFISKKDGSIAIATGMSLSGEPFIKAIVIGQAANAEQAQCWSSEKIHKSDVDPFYGEITLTFKPK